MKIRILSILTILFLVGILFSCDSKVESKAHQEAMVLSDSIQTMYNESIVQIRNMKTIKIMLENKSEELAHSDSLLSRLIFSVNEDIAVCEGLVEKQSILINQHKKYLDRHKKTALAVDQIEMQHDQIEKDFFEVSKDALVISQKLYETRSEAKEFINIEEEKVILK